MPGVNSASSCCYTHEHSKLAASSLRELDRGGVRSLHNPWLMTPGLVSAANLYLAAVTDRLVVKLDMVKLGLPLLETILSQEMDST